MASKGGWARLILLGIDTCGREGSLALARLDKAGRLAPLGTVELAGKTTAAELVPVLGRLLAGGGLEASALQGIVVVDGPGSFTGIRIGVSTAKALAEALALPLFSVSRIEVLSALHADAWVLLDAGRDEFYAGHRTSHRSGEGEDVKAKEWLIRRVDALDLDRLAGTQHPAAVTCEEKVAALLPGVALVPAPSALDAVALALPEVLAGRSVDVATLDGRYMRRLAELYGQAQPAGR